MLEFAFIKKTIVDGHSVWKIIDRYNFLSKGRLYFDNGKDLVSGFVSWKTHKVYATIREMEEAEAKL